MTGRLARERGDRSRPDAAVRSNKYFWLDAESFLMSETAKRECSLIGSAIA